LDEEEKKSEYNENWEKDKFSDYECEFEDQSSEEVQDY
jgi:hypothetical protein